MVELIGGLGPRGRRGVRVAVGPLKGLVGLALRLDVWGSRRGVAAPVLIATAAAAITAVFSAILPGGCGKLEVVFVVLWVAAGVGRPQGSGLHGRRSALQGGVVGA